MRLAAQAKLGFYPTPDGVMERITAYLKQQSKGLIRILDPCAGEGTALKTIGDHLEAQAYGIELDIERGSRAKEILTKCLVTDYQNTHISNQSFSLLWLNPPYDWATRENELERSERYERTFLRDCIKYLCAGGIMVYLIPQKRLDGHIARMLSYRFEQISVFRFPEDDYQAFKQLVIIGALKKKPDKDDSLADYLKKCGQMKAVVPYLPQNPPHIYEVPASPSKSRFLFRSKEIDLEELSEEIEEQGVFDQFREATTPLMMSERITPIMPLNIGHLAQILACGLMNDIVWDKNHRNPLLVKGITRKEPTHKVEIVDKNTAKHIETEKIKIVIHAFDRNGNLLTIQ